MSRQKRSQWNLTVLCEQEEKVDVIAELLKEDDENEADNGFQTTCSLCNGSR